MRFNANFPTTRGPQLMATMAKHFSHKIAVEQQDSQARMTFDWGCAEIAVAENGLSLSAEADSTEAATRIMQVIESHLLRFAFRENPQAIEWTEGSADQ